MTAALVTLDIRARRQWRAWLTKHHASSPGIWLVRHKQHTGVKSMPYEDLVREALCFGWIDSLIKRLDVVWVHLAKRPETRERRLRESRALLAAGKRLGLK